MHNSFYWLGIIVLLLTDVLVDAKKKQFVVKKETSSSSEQSKHGKKLLDESSIETHLLEYDVVIDTHYAITTVNSRLWNSDFTNAEEVEFSVKLPEGAFITKFRMIVDEEAFVGVVLEKEQAEQVYEDAVAAGENAGLVSEESENEFSIISNVAPQTAVTFELTYEQLLERRLGWYEYDLHVISAEDDTIVECHNHFDCSMDQYCDLFKSCYICYDCPIFSDAIDFWCPPCFPEIIPEEPRGSVSVRISVIEEGGFQMYEAPLPLDPVPTLTSESSENLKLMWPPNTEAAPLGEDLSLTLRYQVNPPENDAGRLITDSERGYFVHMFSPPELGTFNKAIMFVLDRSGSMSGRKFEQLQEAVRLIIDTLTDLDYMNFIFFNSVSDAWQNQLVPATEENKIAAKEYVTSMTPRDSTGINDALLLGIRLLEQSNLGMEYAPQIVFLTDGLANVGESSSEGIRANVRAANDQGFSMYCLGLGDNLDYELLRGLALENNGFDRRIGEDDDVVAALEMFYDEIDSTVLSNIIMLYTYDSATCCLAEGVTQNSYQRLFDNSETVVAGKITGDVVNIIATAQGTQADGSDIIFSDAFNIDDAIEASDVRGSTVPVEKIWAFLTLQDILTEIEVLSGIPGNTDAVLQLEKDALQMSLDYHFVTEYTSLVVVPDICQFADDVEGCAQEQDAPVQGQATENPAKSDSGDAAYRSSGAVGAQSSGPGFSGSAGSQSVSSGLFGFTADAIDSAYIEPPKPTCNGDLSVKKITRSCDNIHIKLCSTIHKDHDFAVEVRNVDTDLNTTVQVQLAADECNKNTIVSCSDLFPPLPNSADVLQCDMGVPLEIVIDVENVVCEENEDNNMIRKDFGAQLCDLPEILQTVDPNRPEITPEPDNGWRKYEFNWCTSNGRVLLGNDVTEEECKALCLESCEAVEWWENGFQCYECLDINLMEGYYMAYDSAYPPYVFIKTGTSDNDESPPANIVPVPAPAPPFSEGDSVAGVCRHEHGTYEDEEGKQGVIHTVMNLKIPGNCCMQCLRDSQCEKWEFIPSTDISESMCYLRDSGIPIPSDIGVRKVEIV